MTEKTPVGMGRLIAIQLIVIAILVVAFYINHEQGQALSAAYGGAVSLLLALMLARDISRTAKSVDDNVMRSQALLYLGAVVRFVLVLVLFAVGFAYLKLQGLGLIAGFGLSQLAYAIATAMSRKETIIDNRRDDS